MNSNGAPIQNNFGLDLQRGNPNRYRNNSRRGRGRGPQDRSNQTRNYRDRKPSNWREGVPTNQNDNDVIDIHDNSQWPSIQESSMGTCSRSRNTPAVKIDKPADQPIEPTPQAREPYYETQSNIDPTERRSSVSYRSNYSTINSTGFQPRDQMARYPLSSNRSRIQRYSYSQARTYTGGNYNRRHYRNNFQSLAPVYPTDPNMISTMLNGQIMLPGYPSFQYGNVIKPKEIDAVKQVEYYFSVHNLETDYFIRNQMDSQGWVLLEVVYKFKRIQYIEIRYADFVNRLLTSDLLEIDLEKQKIRTAIDPLKWVNPPSSNTQSEEPLSETTPTTVAIPATPVPPMATSDQYTMNSTYNGYLQNTAYGSYPPLFISVPSGYSGNSQRGRFVPQYGMYPNSYYNMPYNEIPAESGYSYYMQEYYGSYPVSQAYYSGYNQRVDAASEGFDDGSKEEYAVPIENQLTNESRVEDQEVDEEIEEVTQKVSELDVANPPV